MAPRHRTLSDLETERWTEGDSCFEWLDICILYLYLPLVLDINLNVIIGSLLAGRVFHCPSTFLFSTQVCFPVLYNILSGWACNFSGLTSYTTLVVNYLKFEPFILDPLWLWYFLYGSSPANFWQYSVWVLSENIHTPLIALLLPGYFWTILLVWILSENILHGCLSKPLIVLLLLDIFGQYYLSGSFLTVSC